MNRIASLDAVRGIIMVIMALDHARCFFSKSQLLFDPLDLTFTTPALFFTRWITNFCAPGFFLLAGCGAYISAARGKPLKQLSLTLSTRGLWLILLGFTVNKFFWGFSYDISSFTAGIFWCLGCSMIFLSGMVFLPYPVILAVSLSMILFHNCFDAVNPEYFGNFSWIWAILHQKGPIPVGNYFTLYILYPLVPWLGVMAGGYCLGKPLLSAQQERKKTLVVWGIGMLLAFFIIRGLNLYGNPVNWAAQKDAIFTFMNILDCEKYPPSLSYLLITLGPIFLLIAALDKPLGSWFNPLIHLGAVPFFFYIIHIPVLNLLEKIISLTVVSGASWQVNPLGQRISPPDIIHWDLIMTCTGWLLAVLLLYPACRLFSRLKANRKDWWLSYL